jgi:hypothetical protein
MSFGAIDAIPCANGSKYESFLDDPTSFSTNWCAKLS